eukprot:COSAG06_NODE_71234_length_186_cov_53.712644_1_plen_35_part_01
MQLLSIAMRSCVRVIELLLKRFVKFGPWTVMVDAS